MFLQNISFGAGHHPLCCKGSVLSGFMCTILWTLRDNKRVTLCRNFSPRSLRQSQGAFCSREAKQWLSAEGEVGALDGHFAHYAPGQGLLFVKLTSVYCARQLVLKWVLQSLGYNHIFRTA